jgi:sec-independent protein translocase protein TatC
MARVRPIGHEDRLSVVDHLDELRGRLFISGGVLFFFFCICFAFNRKLIKILNRALPGQPDKGLGSQSRQDSALHHFLRLTVAAEHQLQHGLAASKGIAPSAVAAAGQLAAAAEYAARHVRGLGSTQELPITIGIGESFTTTLMVAGYFALLFSLPVLLYQVYAFLLPALRPQERTVAIPTMLAAPILFVVGVVFTYFEILPPAIHFLQGYNNQQFQVLAQASSYYKFEILLMLGIGLAFQVPLLLLGLQKIGVITASTLTVNWRYAIVLIAVIAAALPGVDPVTMAFETLPLILLYIASIGLLQWVERRARKQLIADVAAGASTESVESTDEPVTATDPPTDPPPAS